MLGERFCASGTFKDDLDLKSWLTVKSLSVAKSLFCNHETFFFLAFVDHAILEVALSTSCNIRIEMWSQPLTVEVVFFCNIVIISF